MVFGVTLENMRAEIRSLGIIVYLDITKCSANTYRREINLKFRWRTYSRQQK
jgi:hypothetical protein